MRKLNKALVIVLFILSPLILHAQRVFDITSPFKLWMLNNEARVFSSIGQDELFISRISLPFSFLPFRTISLAKSEEKLWETHRKFYSLLDETQEIYDIAKRFGNGRFNIVFKQSRPELWSLIPLLNYSPWLHRVIGIEFRRAFHSTLLKALLLDEKRDLNLPVRLQNAIKKLSDDEYRLFTDYIETFRALYPSDSTARMLSTFTTRATRTNYAPGIKDLLQPVFTAPAQWPASTPAEAADSSDPLAELERLADFSGDDTEAEITTEDSGSQNQPVAETQPSLEGPPPGTEDLFNIWD